MNGKKHFDVYRKDSVSPFSDADLLAVYGCFFTRVVSKFSKFNQGGKHNGL